MKIYYLLESVLKVFAKTIYIYIHIYNITIYIFFQSDQVVITFATIFFLGKLSFNVLTVFVPSEFGIFVFKDFTSSGSRYELYDTVLSYSSNR